jgi:hypothetical protein
MTDTITDDNPGNFREIRMGSIAPKTLYRSSHPLQYGEQNRHLAMLAQTTRIACVLNLTDTKDQMVSLAPLASWYRRLVSGGSVIALNMAFDFASPDFNQRLRHGLAFLIARNGPYLIHCFAGLDRTGFVAAVLEAFMGATLKEITGDYLRSYGGLFFSAVNTGQYTDNSQVILEQLAAMNNGEPVTDQTVQLAAERYLLDKVGLSKEQVRQLWKKLAFDPS